MIAWKDICSFTFVSALLVTHHSTIRIRYREYPPTLAYLLSISLEGSYAHLYITNAALFYLSGHQFSLHKFDSLGIT